MPGHGMMAYCAVVLIIVGAIHQRDDGDDAQALLTAL
jgi:hypothetical protein